MAPQASPQAYRPRFDNIRGAFAQYLSDNPKPSLHNRLAFIDEMAALPVFDEGMKVESWDAVISEVEDFLMFWKVYYCEMSGEQASKTFRDLRG